MNFKELFIGILIISACSKDHTIVEKDSGNHTIVPNELMGDSYMNTPFDSLDYSLPYCTEHQTIMVKQIEGYTVFEGDILLPKIPFHVALNHPLRKAIHKAAIELSLETKVSFIIRSTQEDYLDFVYGDGCASFLGKIGGKQIIIVGDQCSIGNIKHEMLHALGMYHMHTRSDRDKYIKVSSQNVQDSSLPYYSRLEHTFNPPQYDLSSIMHASDQDFSLNGRPTFVSLSDTSPETYIGQRYGLSPEDVNWINSIYKNQFPQDKKWKLRIGGKGKETIINISQRLSAEKIGTGDFNGDGKVDVLYPNGQDWYISWEGATTWDKSKHSAITMKNLAIGDFDGDGKDDLFYPNGRDWKVSYSGTQSWEKIGSSGITMRHIKIGDFDGDGKCDVFYANGNSWKISYGGTRGWQQVNHSSLLIEDVRIADMDGDGKDDVLFVENNELRYYKGAWGHNGSEKFARFRHSIGSIKTGFFDGDKKADIVFFYPDSDDVYLIGSRRPTDWDRLFSSSYSDPDQYHIGDFNGDGNDDIFYMTY
jgi:hypothetical protein